MTTTVPTPREAAPLPSRRERAPRRRGLEQRVNWAVFTQLLAAGAAAITPARIELINGVDLGLLVGLALVPVWWPSVARFRGASSVLVLGVLALASGLVLSLVNPGDRVFDRALLQGSTGLVLSCLVGFGVLLWVRERLGIGWTAVWFGLGYSVAGFLHPSDIGSPWKYSFGIPVTIAVLGLTVIRRRRPWLEVPLALLMAALFAVSDSRSIFGIAASAALVIAVQAFLPAGSGRVRDTVGPVALLGLAVWGVYRLAMWAIAEGFLGEAARTRTIAQEQISGGNLLAGGRPEMGASIELISAQPWGYGNGLLPNRGDFSAVTQGMAEVSGRLPDPGYVKDYMLSFGFTLHSTLAEFWVRFGFFGLAFVGVVALLTLTGLLRLLARRRLTAVVAFAAFNTLWNLLFSPSPDTLPLLAFSTAVVLASTASRRREREAAVLARVGAAPPAAARIP